MWLPLQWHQDQQYQYQYLQEVSEDARVWEQKRTKASCTFDEELTPFLSIELMSVQFDQPMEDMVREETL